jgi:hypothetical protein
LFYLPLSLSINRSSMICGIVTLTHVWNVPSES